MRKISIDRNSIVPQVLRLGFAFCFIGHGAFGLLQKREWLVYFDLFSIPDDWAFRLMPVVGTVDVLLGLSILLAPMRAALLYGAVWCLFTAALRPLAGQGLAEMLERAGNYGVPIALLLMAGSGPWFRTLRLTLERERFALVATACRWTTAVLLAGHGLLALQGKPLLQQHLAAVGIPANYITMLGAIELSAAFAVLLVPSATLLVGIALWKLSTEALFMVSGAPVWEFIERGGSYAAPLAAALVTPALVRSPASARIAQIAMRATLLLIPIVILPTGVRGQEVPAFTAALLQDLKQGGFVVACRHAITSHEREDRMPVNLDDPSTQRVLSPEGEQQATQLGKDLQEAGIPFGEVLASPYQRTRRSAELMFAHVTIDTALSMSGPRDAQLRALLTTPPPAGKNRLLMTHQGILYRVFTNVKHGSVPEGSCLIAKPDGNDFKLLAIAHASDWLKPR